MEIYTIGHSNYSIDKFIDMLKFYNINCIVDIRGTPYSKYNTQFNKENIRETLIKSGYIYIYMGKEFAVQREDRSLYLKEGYADFERVIEDRDFLGGVERLRVGCEKGYRIALMGAMQDPINCHRCVLLGRTLRDKGFNLKHIMDDYTIATQEELEERLLDKFYDNRNQLTIENFMGEGSSKEEMLKECYRRSNKEIGYRVEKIEK